MSVVSDFLDGLGATLLVDEENITQPVFDSYVGSLAADPSAVNVAAQTVKFEADLAALGPQAASQAIKDSAIAAKKLIDVQLPALAAKYAAELQAQASATATSSQSPPAVTPAQPAPTPAAPVSGTASQSTSG